MEDRQKIIAKLVKIKALAERGIGGDAADSAGDVYHVEREIQSHRRRD